MRCTNKKLKIALKSLVKNDKGIRICDPGGIEDPIDWLIASIEPQTAFAVLNFSFSIAFQNAF